MKTVRDREMLNKERNRRKQENKRHCGVREGGGMRTRGMQVPEGVLSIRKGVYMDRKRRGCD